MSAEAGDSERRAVCGSARVHVRAGRQQEGEQIEMSRVGRHPERCRPLDPRSVAHHRVPLQ